MGILAPSGVGKTTLLQCLGGYLSPSKGSLVFDGSHDVTQELEAYRHAIGYVMQDDVVFLKLTVLENLIFAAKLRLGRAANSHQIEEAVNQALERTNISGQKNLLAMKLSGGQRKRLSVAIELLKISGHARDPSVSLRCFGRRAAADRRDLGPIRSPFHAGRQLLNRLVDSGEVRPAGRAEAVDTVGTGQQRLRATRSLEVHHAVGSDVARGLRCF